MTEETFEKKSLNYLKQIYELPKFHITNRISDLRAEVDLAFSQLVNDSEVKNSWPKIIEILEDYERDCCKSVEKNLNEKFTAIESVINTNEPECNELIQDEKHKIEKILFLNKTMMFLNEIKCENKSLFDQHNKLKLIIIKDEFIANEDIETLVKSSNFQITDKLNNQKIKLKLLKTKLIGLSSQINEIDLCAKSLEELDFYSLKLNSVHASTFHDFSNLRRLSLRGNNLTKIHSTTFHTLVNLENLNLDDNQLNLLDLDTFKGLFNLRELSINSNKLSSIQVDLFKGLENLNSIWCNRNNISELCDYAFRDLINLMWLSLGYNQIKTIHLKAFEGLTNLKELYIDNNKLKSIKSRIFEPLDNLQTLCLNKNPVTYSIKILGLKLNMNRSKPDCTVYTHKKYFL